MSQYNRDQSPEELQADIAETRAEIGTKIDMISDRVSPERLKVEAQETVNDMLTDTADAISHYIRTNGQEITSSIADGVKRNPIPAALIGLGLGWMAIETLRSPEPDDVLSRRRQYALRRMPGDSRSSVGAYERRGYYAGDYYGGDYYGAGNYDSDDMSTEYSGAGNVARDYDDSYYVNEEVMGHVADNEEDWSDDVREQATRMRHQARRQARETQHQVKEGLDEAGRQVSDTASDIKQNVQEFGSEVGDRAQNIGENITDRAQSVGQEIGYRTDEARRRANQMSDEYARRARMEARRAGRRAEASMEENPLLYGALALGAGLALGLLLPQTRLENRYLGETSDQFVESAQTVARDAAQRAQNVVEEVKPELERTARQVRDDLSEAGRETMEDVKQTAQKASDNVAEATQTAKDKAAKEGEKTAKKAEKEASKVADKAKDEASRKSPDASTSRTKSGSKS